MFSCQLTLIVTNVFENIIRYTVHGLIRRNIIAMTSKKLIGNYDVLSHIVDQIPDLSHIFMRD